MKSKILTGKVSGESGDVCDMCMQSFLHIFFVYDTRDLTSGPPERDINRGPGNKSGLEDGWKRGVDDPSPPYGILSCWYIHTYAPMHTASFPSSFHYLEPVCKH